MLAHILEKGEWVENRTDIDTLKVTALQFEHDMSIGFPVITTKQMFLKSGMVELEGFINGITDKDWYQKRGCHFWDKWCNPQKVQWYDKPLKLQKQKEEMDLGYIYGYQWRSFNENRMDELSEGVDQLMNIIETLKENPLDRRMICSAWNPQQLDEMALPPCHVMFQCLCNGKDLDLIWYQRSCDMFLGVPYNIMSYAMLLELIAATTGMKPRKLVGINFWRCPHLSKSY
jgi:thymidylate synthase